MYRKYNIRNFKSDANIPQTNEFILSLIQEKIQCKRMKRGWTII